MNWRAGKKEKFDELMSSPDQIAEILKAGGEKARAKALTTMSQVREQIGLTN